VSKPLIIMVGADKGGVGKTMVCRAMIDYFEARKVPLRIFDSEHPAGDLRRFHSAAQVIDLTSIKDQMTVFDDLGGSVSIVDIRAGMLTPILATLDKARVLDDVRAGHVNMAILHVLGPSVSSLNEVGAAVSTIGGGARHFIVKNRINDTDFDLMNGARYADTFKALAPVTVNVPKLSELAAERIQAAGSTFVDFGNSGQSRMLCGTVRAWLHDVWLEFDRVGLTQLVTDAVM
jgi:hypothetical protein